MKVDGIGKDSVPMTPRVKCLLVDDLEENLIALAALLRREDVEVLQARSGADALELLLEHDDVALAFLDVQMPEMDGFELAELMRGSERTRDIPIIFVTAGAHDQRRRFKGYDAGAVDFLYKPLEPHVLRNKAEVFFQLHRQKQQLAHQLEELTETLRLNEMFTAVLGHDLRNPLSAILTAADLLFRRTEDPAVRKSASRMLTSGKRMGRMIEDVLDLARARLAGGIPLRRSETDFGLLVQRIVQEHHAAFPQHSLDVRKEGDLVGDWDSDRLAQVASNLIGNALQHGDTSEPVQLRLDGSHADSITFSVSNVGVIPAEQQPYLFDPFRGCSQQRARTGGLGLGLYIVQQIIHAHHGSVDVESGSGRHTVFRVVLPRRGTEVIKL
ncbi:MULTISPECIES: hybrid sensor histidine kinase/response regulator [Myxococcus]|uniref:histidine kinase n=1 Tax=Myxococcus virescens TaxID=83456 RepID=A0A511HF38_9BACT|nr:MULTISPECIES: HAMP domain-containing sensor histidine kinase [Myxococcus]WNZ59588.1 HAMP domain-containing sensor histidine kinase [Myxococcus sp. MxC21-1]GEL72166.1 hybrid sensor histidine kinase/response regulator [Myxococcus virescens]SDE84857.1 Signal transduction histidine kinase [Myxococcus virescens]